MTESQDRHLFNKARRILVGGVNSPVRSFRSVGGTPVFIKKGKGAYLFGENGKRYLDFCLSWGAMILGHAHPKVVSAVKKAVSSGASFGTASALEIELADKIQRGIPSMERIRFTNSGTEAVMGALRLARAYTKKDLIVKFDGCYHGHADYLLAKAGSGAFGLPDSAGVPKGFTKNTIVLPYNDLSKVEKTLREHNQKIAALIVEPVAGNMGVILPREDFLPGLRMLCDRYGIVLVFDEVITGFRFCFGGAQNYFGVIPDLTILGKIIGGGLPIGAFGGRKEIMNLLAPEGPVYQAGTFSGNPLSMSAGIAALDVLSRKGTYKRLWSRSEEFYAKLRKIATLACIPFQLNAIGPVFSIFFAPGPVCDARTARKQDVPRFKKFFHELLKQGIYFSPSPFEVNFMSLACAPKDLKKTSEAINKAFHIIGENL